MREQLALTEPSLDTSVGTVTRKLLDAVGEALSEVSIDRYLVDYQYDIETKGGAELDRFVELFGFSRIAPRRATGLVQVVLTSPADRQITLPSGTLFFTEDSPPVRFASVVPSIIFRGQTSVEVPVQAVDAGARGNVPASAISQVASSQGNNLSGSNLQATSNGRDAESDEQLRRRFRATVFRKMAGTEDSFLGVSLETEGVRAANVLGAQKVYREQVDVTDVGDEVYEATSTLEGARFVYPSTVTFGRFIDGGDILLEDTAYTFTRTVPPKVTLLDADPEEDLGLYELEFGYCPSASRNVPENDITNRVDIWLTGEEARRAPGRGNIEEEAAEVLRVRDRKFVDGLDDNEDTAADIGRERFVRWAYDAPDPGDPIDRHPAEDNWFVPLSFGPIVTVGGKVATESGMEYTLGENCWIVHEDGPFGWAPRSRFGLEITDAAVPKVGGGTQALAIGDVVSVSYVYNALPKRVQANIQDWRLVTMDVWVHQAKPKYLTMNFVVVPEVGFTESDVEREIDEVLSEMIDDLGFVKVLQASDVLRAAASATGVDGIRWTTNNDASGAYAIQEYVKSVSEATTPGEITTYNRASLLLDTFEDGGRVTDVRVPDDEIIVYNGCNVTLRADNTFGTS